jgi:hypothetical protein
MEKNFSKPLTDIINIFVGLLAFAISIAVYPTNHYVSAIILVLCGIGIYFSTVLLSPSKDWMDLNSVFSLVWLSTIGLACLRLAGYQEPWEGKTWACLALAYGIFHVGIILGNKFGIVKLEQVGNAVKRKMQKRIDFSLHEDRLFWICVIVTLVGLLCFCANVAIKGFIPFFSKSTSAYVDFYTKLHVFAVAATMISGLCYYTLKTQKLTNAKKITLICCIIYATFLFPILVVSRGTFITSALALTTVIFYLNKKKLCVLLACVIAMAAVYEGCSKARNYTEAQLQYLFKPNEITVHTDQEQDGNLETQEVTITLPGKVAFVYTYLTVGHDNLNEAVQNVTTYSYGIRQMIPFNVVLRTRFLEEKYNTPDYYVEPYLNTYNLVGHAYYDFGIIGICVLMLIWSFAFGIAQAFYKKHKGPFSLLNLAHVMIPVALCFFTAWMSFFTLWMFWGLIAILWIATNISLKKE